MRKSATVAVAVGLFVGGMGTAVADGWQTMSLLKSSGVRLIDADYKWEPKGQNHGAFHFRGTLKDHDPDDGHNVYVQAKVEGYRWNRYNGAQKKKVYLDKLVYDGAAQYTSNAEIRVCRDRGSLHPDNCSVTRKFTR